jgi:acetylornithine/succinyldiaminopimelate/putrescine aminotransferase
VEIRRNGLLLAVELDSSERLYKIMDIVMERGNLSDWFLYCDTAFRISPPLVITDAEIYKCVEIIVNCLNDL